MTYTIPVYIATIQRELDKRKTTYPRIMGKRVKAGATEAEQIALATTQRLQYELLEDVLTVLKGNNFNVPEELAEAMLDELQRELKMRKRYYPRLLYFKRIAPEVATYETAIWTDLVQYWKDTFITN
jgi:hypothetical protein